MSRACFRLHGDVAGGRGTAKRRKLRHPEQAELRHGADGPIRNEQHHRLELRRHLANTRADDKPGRGHQADDVAGGHVRRLDDRDQWLPLSGARRNVCDEEESEGATRPSRVRGPVLGTRYCAAAHRPRTGRMNRTQ